MPSIAFAEMRTLHIETGNENFPKKLETGQYAAYRMER
jgi:hypothetical protein